jgi:hypothetical protein
MLSLLLLRSWQEAAFLILERLHPDAVAIFYQVSRCAMRPAARVFACLSNAYFSVKAAAPDSWNAHLSRATSKLRVRGSTRRC